MELLEAQNAMLRAQVMYLQAQQRMYERMLAQTNEELRVLETDGSIKELVERAVDVALMAKRKRQLSDADTARDDSSDDELAATMARLGVKRVKV